MDWLVQAGHKRSKSIEEPAVPAQVVTAPSADVGAKQALENEFECTICRVRALAALSANYLVQRAAMHFQTWQKVM